MVKDIELEKYKKKINRIESLKWIDDVKQHELNVLYEDMNKLLLQDIRYK